MVCVFTIIWDHPKAQLKVALEKPEIDSATPGLQGIGLILYITTTLDVCTKNSMLGNCYSIISTSSYFSYNVSLVRPLHLALECAQNAQF